MNEVMTENTTDKAWYVVQVRSGSEDWVAKALKERIESEKQDNEFGDILVPTEKVLEMRGGKKRRTERKFFPGYILVEMMLSDETWHLVRNVPKVLGFIGGKGGQPAPISNKEAEAMLHRMQESVDKPRPKVSFQAGEVVRVIDGPFSDFEGTIEEVNYEKSKVRVAVSIFGRSTPVELDFIQVEKI